MTLATDIASLGTYDSSDITNMINEAFDQLSLYYKSTLTENLDEDWDRIAKIYAIYLLDRLTKQRQQLSDSSISIPPLMSEEVKNLIENLQTEADSTNEFKIDISSDVTDIHWRNV